MVKKRGEKGKGEEKEGKEKEEKEREHVWSHGSPNFVMGQQKMRYTFICRWHGRQSRGTGGHNIKCLRHYFCRKRTACHIHAICNCHFMLKSIKWQFFARFARIYYIIQNICKFEARFTRAFNLCFTLLAWNAKGGHTRLNIRYNSCIIRQYHTAKQLKTIYYSLK